MKDVGFGLVKDSISCAFYHFCPVVFLVIQKVDFRHHTDLIHDMLGNHHGSAMNGLGFHGGIKISIIFLMVSNTTVANGPFVHWGVPSILNQCGVPMKFDFGTYHTDAFFSLKGFHQRLNEILGNNGIIVYKQKILPFGLFYPKIISTGKTKVFLTFYQKNLGVFFFDDIGIILRRSIIDNNDLIIGIRKAPN